MMHYSGIRVDLSLLSPQDLHGVDFTWFPTSVSEPRELRREGSPEPEWAVLCVAVLVCLRSLADCGMCRSEPLQETLSWNCPHLLKFPLKQEACDHGQESVDSCKPQGPLGEMWLEF